MPLEVIRRDTVNQSNDSILNGIKRLLGGISADYTVFDSEVIDYINNVISTLSDLGVSQADTFCVNDDSDEWSDFIEDRKLLGFVKIYISQKVKLNFDPPSSSIAVDAIQKSIAENEWRIANYKINSTKGGN